MNSNAENDFLFSELADAIQQDDETAASQAGFAIDMHVLEQGNVPPGLFAELLSLLETDWFLRSDLAVHGIRVFDSNADLLSNAQQSALFDALQRVYPSLQSSDACFLAVELIASVFLDERSFEALASLATVPEEIPRALVPHGLEWLAFESGDAEVTKNVRRLLRTMTDDFASSVREEAMAALAKLERRSS